MSSINLAVEMVAGVAHSEKRAVAFLRGHPDLTAGPEFDRESTTPLGKKLKHKMGLWIAFLPDTAGKFHRFKSDAQKYRDCFTFEDLDAQVRIYGFTCHPKTDRRFELVLLISWVQKKTKHTDYAELDRVLIWKDNFLTHAALRAAFSNTKGEP
ncbi:MAG TPA: hypothetical protein VKL99_06755 [Candidatus Angelobacter sp.]|nr:hypothetical protein [Candidatus Angelobacter sp.]